MDQLVVPPPDGEVTLKVIETFVGVVLVAEIETLGDATGGTY
jgi:hypothetical protein